MISLQTFHSLRRPDLCPESPERFRDRAERGLLFCYGKKKLDQMSVVERAEALAVFSAQLEKSANEGDTNYWMECNFITSDDDGLYLAYPEIDRGKLAKLEIDVSTPAPNSSWAHMLGVLKPQSAEQTTKALQTLSNLGLPFIPGMSWAEAGPLLHKEMRELAIGKPWQSQDEVTRRTVWGLSDGLYCTFQFEGDQLATITLIDSELVRANQIEDMQKSLRELESSKSGDGMNDEGLKITIETYREKLQRATEARLDCLEGILAFFYDLPLESDVEYSTPPLSLFRTPPEPPADDRPQWLKNLTEAEMLEYQQIIMNADMEIMFQLMTQAGSVQSLHEFRQLRDSLQVQPENQATILANRNAMAPNVTRFSPAGVRSRVYRIIKRHFKIEFKTNLSGEETLRGNLQACDDDLHSLRTMLGVQLNINFRSTQWESIVTVSDLVARVHHLIENPDLSPREEVPITTIQKELTGTRNRFAGSMQQIHTAMAGVTAKFEEDVSAYLESAC